MNKSAIKDGLKKLGLKTGDVVLLHSSLPSLGQVDGGGEAVVDAFLEVIGKDGTLVAPVFGKLGILTAVIKNHPEAEVSDCPFGTVAAIGRQAKEFCQNHWQADTVHGENTPYLKIADAGGYICLLGVDQDRNTTMHSVEALLQLPYLQESGERTFSTSEGEQCKRWKHYPGPHRDFINLDSLLLEAEIMKMGRIGNAQVRLIDSRAMLDLCCAVGEEDPAFVLCDNPNCKDCLTQRAAISASELECESFSLVTSALLAGRYVPEMIENMQESGISQIELDYIQGQPIQNVSKEKLAQAVKELRDNGCEVVSLRSSCLDADISKLLEMAVENNIQNLVIPFNADVAKYSEQAAACKVNIAFYNTVQSSEYVKTILKKAKSAGRVACLAFSAVNFAMTGEKPFLTSYRNGLRSFIVQLDLEDMTHAGSPTGLAEGNAEVKELISILRCRNFSGRIVLGAKNRFTATLQESAAEFKYLLETM
ncbi:MAG: AAC(3) family N-acetyltransferase [Victivallaceae bacterium]|nr:AAC(3) family N-acetyltransferase [Victivallaceae bacterium]